MNDCVDFVYYLECGYFHI